jgi:hypothetical protein
VEGRPLGTITNTDGDFLLRAPAPAGDASIRISHIGFNSRTFPARLLGGQPVSLYLTRRIISIQEVIIRYMDPNIIISRALEQRKLNYSLQPVYQTAFYREGVTRNRNYTSYAEAVFRIYKSPFAAGGHGDQIKLLKSRKIQDASPRDTVFVKLKAGVLSALELDLVKYVPDFLDDDRLSRYDFTYTNLVSYDDRTAYAIDFVQKAEVNEPLFMGTIYVDQESYAILGAEFRVNPRHLEQAAENLVFRKSRRLNVKFEQISYSVNYTPVNGKYMLNHARCDMVIRTKLRGRLTSDNFTTFLELASCATDTASVQKFDRQEVLPPSIVFSDADLKYDESFWGEYNIIVPEERLNVTLSRIRARIEEIR